MADLGFHKVDSQLALCLILVVGFLGHELRRESAGRQSLRSPARSHTRTVDPGHFAEASGMMITPRAVVRQTRQARLPRLGDAPVLVLACVSRPPMAETG
jgi:hypothetical protein